MTQLLNVISTVQEKLPAKVGDPATIVMYTDRHAATVIAVSKSGKTITIQHDLATRTDKNGWSENQTYEYQRNVQGRTEVARLGKYGWRIGGRNGTKVLIGIREEYWDPSF